jgi:hypothetical protein
MTKKRKETYQSDLAQRGRSEKDKIFKIERSEATARGLPVNCRMARLAMEKVVLDLLVTITKWVWRIPPQTPKAKK